MDGSPPSYCTLWDTKKQSRFLCYTRREHGTWNVCLTDAADVWSTEDTEDTWNQCRFALNSPEDYILKLRSACGRGEGSVVVRDTSAELHVSSGPGEQSVTLSRLEGPQAAKELKELLFRMADRLTQPEGGSPSVSPVRNPQRRPTEFEPQQQQSCAPSLAMKKRLPGASLINPGAKRTRQATGVAFDDED
ncbi:protein PAXX isoform X2 [Cyclopterus lumpus]|uniref:protein PAXX isoform X2 n=1 Tax=Cyclopterus lumpus TaxID=8103 RepID=UPI0014865D25|nr:protein PAXX isoform X2 [Cyclopterus lumpus]